MRHYKGIEFLTLDEIKKIINCADNIKEKALIWLMFSKGLRASEVSLIKISDIDLEKRRIYIRRLKNSISNILPLTDEDIYYLKKYLKKRKSNLEYLFVNNRNKPLSRISVFMIFRKLCKKANIPLSKAHPHILKHSCAVYLLERTGDIKFVQDILGHKNIQNTVIYARYIDKERDKKYLKAFEENLFKKLKEV